MSRRIRHLAVVLAALLSVPLATPPVVHAAEDEPAEGAKVLVQLKVQHAGKTHEHPGYVAELGEESILELSVGEHAYEVSVKLEKREGKWALAVVFSVDGTEVASGTNAAAKPKTWVEFKKGEGTVVSVRFDPSTTRKGQVEMPGGKGPLDGAK
jgi:hypothetical protein